MSETAWVKVDVDGLEVDRITTVVAAGRAICLTRTAAGYGALDNHCPHQGGPVGDLADAEVDSPSRLQLWPEHFDLAVDMGPDGARANFGGSPGDDAHPEPYLYIGPWAPREGTFWNESFGASLSYAEILGGADPLEFLRHGKELLQL